MNTKQIKKKVAEIRKAAERAHTPETKAIQNGRADGIEAAINANFERDVCGELRTTAREKFTASKPRTSTWEYWSAYLGGLGEGEDKEIL